MSPRRDKSSPVLFKKARSWRQLDNRCLHKDSLFGRNEREQSESRRRWCFTISICSQLKVPLTIIVLRQFFVPYVHLYENFSTRNINTWKFCNAKYFQTMVICWPSTYGNFYKCDQAFLKWILMCNRVLYSFRMMCLNHTCGFICALKVYEYFIWAPS